MPNRLVWHNEPAKAIEREFNGRLNVCAIALTNHAKKLISIEGAGKTGPGRGAGGRFTKGKLIYGANPSAPGDPPHKQTGRLMGSVAWEAAELVRRVGSNVTYSRWLELGTSRMAPRPWLRRALYEMTPFIRAVISRPMRNR